MTIKILKYLPAFILLISCDNKVLQDKDTPIKEISKATINFAVDSAKGKYIFDGYNFTMTRTRYSATAPLLKAH